MFANPIYVDLTDYVRAFSRLLASLERCGDDLALVLTPYLRRLLLTRPETARQRPRLPRVFARRLDRRPRAVRSGSLHHNFSKGY